ncbi:hypothetical protein Barb7_02184 [Bacteroidales bacterium Barb7]|nr:hypothetical protein Barb7_02184 [Bacteroidales bacterium Barb7]
MFVRRADMLMEVSPVLKKTIVSRRVRALGRVMEVRERQLAKASFPMVITLLGMVTDLRVPSFLKRACPISATAKFIPANLM